MDREALVALRAKIIEGHSFSADDAIALVDLILADPPAPERPKAKPRRQRAEK